MTLGDDDSKRIRDLEAQSRSLQALIEEARRVQREVEEHLRRIRRGESQMTGTPRKKLR
jgi:hypothetical protein